MGVFNSTAQPNISSFQNARGGQPRNDRPAAKVWLNIGYMHDLVDDEGVVTPTFIGLPMGIAVDTMEKRNAGGSELMQAKNALLDKFQAAAMALKPGEERLIEAEGGIWIQLRRVAEREEATAANNSFIASLEKLAI